MFHIGKPAEKTYFDGFLLHTLKTTDKVLRYGENSQVDYYEHPTVVQQGDERTINICCRSKCYIVGQDFYILEIETPLFYNILKLKNFH